jgi:hypothetical protein
MSEVVASETQPSTARAENSPEIDKIAEALAAAQGEIEAAEKDSLNPHFKSSYADLASVRRASQKPLCRHKLAIVQQVWTFDGVLTLVTKLIHASGQWLRSEYPVEPVQKNPQGTGSALSYARRYSWMAMLGMAADDDDGNAASGRPSSRDEQHAANGDKWRQLPQEDERAQQRQGPVKFAEVPDTADRLPADVAKVRRELSAYEGKRFSELDDASLGGLQRVLDEMTKKASNDNKVQLATLSVIIGNEIKKRVKDGAA